MSVISHDVILHLFRDHREAVVGFLFNRVRCPDVAQDLSQEAYLRLLRKSGVAHDDNLAGYLFRIAERLAIDYLRSSQRAFVSEPLDENIVSPQPEPGDLALLREQCELLLDAITSLPKRVRAVFLLRKIDELSYSEIASRLGISEKTVQRHLVKAMLHCHRRLELGRRG